MKKYNLTGQKFTRLMVIEKAPTHITSGGNKVGMWKCKCDCGNTTTVGTGHLINGSTKSCGCYSKDLFLKYITSDTPIEKKNVMYPNNIKHGYSQGADTDVRYALWGGIKKRCYNERSSNYEYYGGRGIGMCEDWINSPEVFIDWCKNNGYEKGLEIDRINNDGNYEPSNCRFVTRSENCSNRGKFKNNTSGYTGIQKRKTNGKWSSIIHKNKKAIYLGDHNTIEEALDARNKYIVENNLIHNTQEYERIS